MNQERKQFMILFYVVMLAALLLIIGLLLIYFSPQKRAMTFSVVSASASASKPAASQ